LAGDAAGSGQEAHGFPITALKRNRNPHPLAVVAADLKAVGTPTPVMAPLVPANVALKKIDDMGQTNNTIVGFTTDNRAEAISFPDGGVTPFRGQKGEAWEGGYRAPLVMRWPGVIKPGTVVDQLFAALDWVPTLVDIAGGAKGDGLKKQIEAGQYPGIV